MKKSHTQAGKGLSGFIIGLLLATIVIAAVLFFLNKNKTTFRQPETQTQPPTPEVLTPGGSPPLTTSAPQILPLPGASDALGEFIASQEQTTTEAPIGKPATPKPTARPPTEKPAKVRPEQILNSGSLEKAQQQANKEKPVTKGVVRLQAGSFKDNDAADAQRAKLAMLGVDAQVVKGTANGQTVYRVQTGALSHQQAEKTTQLLRQNQIDSLMHKAP